MGRCQQCWAAHVVAMTACRHPKAHSWRGGQMTEPKTALASAMLLRTAIAPGVISEAAEEGSSRYVGVPMESGSPSCLGAGVGLRSGLVGGRSRELAVEVAQGGGDPDEDPVGGGQVGVG